MWSKKSSSSNSPSSVSFTSVSPYRETTQPSNVESHRYTLNSLWSCWYGALAVVFQVYIISKSVTRFTGYLSLSWPKNSTPYTELNAYVVLVGSGVILLPFFAVSAIMKIGNLSNDGTKVGEDDTTFSSSSLSPRRRKYDSLGKKSRVSIANANSCSVKLDNDESQLGESIYANFTHSTDTYTGKISSSQEGKCTLLVNIWKHMLPIAAFLHVASAFAFLFPRVLMESQLIVHGFLPKSDIWKTEMDCVLDFIQDGRLELLDFLDPINDTEKTWLKQTLAAAASNGVSLISTTQLVSTDSSTSPLIVQATRSSISQKLDLTPGSMSLEFINLIIALLIILVRYPSIFWRSNKAFATLMSLQIFITSIVLLVIYSSFSILYKVHIITPDRALLRYPNTFTLTTSQTVFLAIFLTIMFILSSGILCMYGQTKFIECKRKQFNKSHITSRKQSSSLSSSSSSCCCGFAPHLLAFTCLMVKAVAAVPLMYDLIVVYCGSLDSASLVGAFAIAFYLLEYIIVWLILTIKHSWNFTVTIDDDVLSTSQQLTTSREAALLPGQKSFTLSAKGESPLLVIDHGTTYQVREFGSKAAIRSLATKGNRLPGKAMSSLAIRDMDSANDTQEYWLKPCNGDDNAPATLRQNANVNDKLSHTLDGAQSDDVINETRTLSWLRRSARSRSSTSCSDDVSSTARLMKKKKHSSLKDANGKCETEAFLTHLNQVDECTGMKQIAHDTEGNPGNSGMLNTLPEEREDRPCLQSNSHMMNHNDRPINTGNQRHASMNGDYELLVDSNQYQLTSGYSNEYDVYGVRRLFSQAPTVNRVNSCISSSYQPMKFIHNESGGYSSSNVSSNASPSMTSGGHNNNLPYRHGRIGSISSESSTSPEKLSETSSGIASACPSITSEKRCASAENLHTLISSSSNNNQNNNVVYYPGTAHIHSRASFRTSSLQRGPIQVRCPKVTLTSQPESPFCSTLEPLPPPMAQLDTMRRMKQQQEQRCSESSRFTGAQLQPHSRQASFTESSDIDKLMSQPLPPPPPETLTSVSLLDSAASTNFCHTLKPIVSIAPQLPHPANTYTFASQTATFLPPPIDALGKDVQTTDNHLASEFERQIQKHFL